MHTFYFDKSSTIHANISHIFDRLRSGASNAERERTVFIIRTDPCGTPVENA